MQVRYSRPFALFLLALGAVDILLALILFSLHQSAVGPLIPGIACLLVSFLYLTRVYFTYDQQRIVVHALIGSYQRELHYRDADRFELQGSKLYLHTAAGRRRIPVSRFLADKRDWADFLRFLKL